MSLWILAKFNLFYNQLKLVGNNWEVSELKHSLIRQSLDWLK